MKCSDCGRPVKPVVALDIDGTLGDYHAHFIRFLREYLGVQSYLRLAMYDGGINFGDWVCRAFEIDRRTYRDIKLAYRQGAQKRSMPMYTDASILAGEIRRAGADLWLTTSRPYLRLDNIDPDTRAWLERNNVEYDHLLYDEDKYNVLAGQIDPARVCAVLDDLPEMYDAAVEAFGGNVPILRRTDWNDAADRPNYVVNLQQARRLIGERIRSWNTNNN